MSDKTRENLHAAYTGEAKASVRLWAYAQKAEEEGLPQIARLFRAISAAERVHALRHMRLLGEIGDTEENLAKSFESEQTVSENYYGEFMKQAEADGNKAAFMSFSQARDAEQVHASLYKKAMAHMTVDEETSYFVCSICGYVADGQAPETCPICGAPASKFFQVD